MKYPVGRQWNTHWAGNEIPCEGNEKVKDREWNIHRGGMEYPKANEKCEGQGMKYPEGRNDIPHGKWKMQRAGIEMPPKATMKWLRHFISYFYWGDWNDCEGNCLCSIIKVVGTSVFPTYYILYLLYSVYTLFLSPHCINLSVMFVLYTNSFINFVGGILAFLNSLYFQYFGDELFCQEGNQMLPVTSLDT